MNSTKLSLLVLFAVCLLFSCGRNTSETKPERRNITVTVFATGILIPENKFNLTSESEGTLVSVLFDEGDTVSPGSVLAVIGNKTSKISSHSAEQLLSLAAKNNSPDAPALKQAEANATVAVERFKQDSLLADRYIKLFETGSVSKLDMEKALLNFENSKASLIAAKENLELIRRQAEQQFIAQKSQAEISSVLKDNNEVKALFPGKVYQKFKEQGDYIRKGEILAIIGHPDKLYARVSIDETNIRKVEPGQKAIIRLNTDKDKNYTGSVKSVLPAFDEKTQSFYCEINFSDPLDFRVAGTQLQANIITGERENILVIPTNYLGYGNKVMVKGEGEVNVQTGFVSNEWVEITAGLNEEAVITTYKIDKK